MKKDIESLKGALKSIVNYEYNKTFLLKYNLADKERMVHEYIRDNPGCNKQSVVEHFNNMDIPGLSRNPIFNIIKSLIERGYVIEERDRHNKNTRRLFPNEQHVILSVTDEIEDFRNRFLELLESPHFTNIQNEDEKNQILKYVDEFYSKFVGICIFRALPAFRKMISDKQTLHELYNVIFSNVILIQEKYYEFDSQIKTSYFMDTPLYVEVCTDDDDYDRKIQLFKNNGMEEQIIPLLERLDGISYRYAKQHRILSQERTC